MDSDEEDSAEEDDEGVNPASTESGIFDVEDSGFEGLTFDHSQTNVTRKSKLSPIIHSCKKFEKTDLLLVFLTWHAHT